MMAKDSVKNRLDAGLSFTEFSYQLVQGYDFYWLFQNKNVKLQMGGSDQWGNIVTGTELIRRKVNGDAFALTTPLIKKADGKKFGKTEQGNVWLDARKTSPYKFYQYWLNTSDDDASNFIRIFTLRTKEDIEALVADHAKAPHERKLQQQLAKDITLRVHSQQDYDAAVKASSILFGDSVTDDLQALDEATLLDIFDGVPRATISESEYQNTGSVTDLLTVATGSVVFPSKGEARKMIQGGGVSINKVKIQDAAQKPDFKLLQNKYLLAQKGKKNYYLIVVE
jgi:tyrosyl-tRNA synthetase